MNARTGCGVGFIAKTMNGALLRAVWLVLVVVLGLGSAGGGQGCPSCPPEGVWPEDSAFADRWEQINPYTTGLPVGAQAPAIPGVDYGEKPTVVVGAHDWIDPYWMPQLAQWAQRDDLQLVLIGCNLKAQYLEAIEQHLSGKATLITGLPDALMQCVLWRLAHPVPPPVVFLVSQTGVVLHTLRNFRFTRAAQYDAIISHFAAHWEPPPGALPHRFFWQGDRVPWPPVPLYTLEGEEVYLGPGTPRLIYVGQITGEKGELIFSQLEGLREAFPQVEFSWWLEKISPEAIRSACWYSFHYGPEEHRVPVDECIRELEGRAVERLEQWRALAEGPARGWRVLLDQDFRVSLFLGLVGHPAVMILDAEGYVKLPFTIYPARKVFQQDEGQWEIHPQAESELSRLLEEASSGQ